MIGRDLAVPCSQRLFLRFTGRPRVFPPGGGLLSALKLWAEMNIMGERGELQTGVTHGKSPAIHDAGGRMNKKTMKVRKKHKKAVERTKAKQRASLAKKKT